MIPKLPFVLLLVCLLTAGTVAAQDESAFTVTNLTDNIYLLSVDEGNYTTNSLALVGEDGLLLVDTHHANYAEDFKKTVDALGKGLPTYIINTHRHVEHIGGNAVFGSEPIKIAHSLFPEKLVGGSYIFDEFPSDTYPDITFADSLTLKFNGETIRMFSVAGSHDDNEIAVHFVNGKVAHISSITNGFNFPSTDADGSVLKYAEIVSRAMNLLPEDVTIVSGHNAPGRWEQFAPYIEMVENTIGLVRTALEEGKDLEAMKADSLLNQYAEYAGSYVSVNGWLGQIVSAFEDDGEPEKKGLYEPLYVAWKSGGHKAALTKYQELKETEADTYEFGEIPLIVIGDKLQDKGHYEAAAAFLEADLLEYPDGQYAYYAYYVIAQAKKELGVIEEAVAACEKALEINPDFAGATALLEELKKN